MQALQQRVKALEVGDTRDATQKAVQQAQADMLLKLREIRQSVQEGAAGTASTKELDALKAENEALRKQTTKQEYRIRHLVGTVEELMVAAK